MKGPVTQEWVHSLSFMQQSVLFASIRGPDGIAKNHVAKNLLRWYRRCVLISAFDGRTITTPYDFGGGSFTGPSYRPTTLIHDWRPNMDPIVSDYLQTVDELPHHFQLHFMHAAEVLGYKHPDPLIRDWWFVVYQRLVNDMHLYPETEEQLDRRLGDTREGWEERNEPEGRAPNCSL